MSVALPTWYKIGELRFWNPPWPGTCLPGEPSLAVHTGLVSVAFHRFLTPCEPPGFISEAESGFLSNRCLTKSFGFSELLERLTAAGACHVTCSRQEEGQLLLPGTPLRRFLWFPFFLIVATWILQMKAQSWSKCSCRESFSRFLSSFSPCFFSWIHFLVLCT